MATANITVTPGCGAGSRVEIGGHDITDAVRGLTPTATVGAITRLELELELDVTTMADTDTVVLIPDATRDALTALGWTPPADG